MDVLQQSTIIHSKQPYSQSVELQTETFREEYSNQSVQKVACGVVKPVLHNLWGRQSPEQNLSTAADSTILTHNNPKSRGSVCTYNVCVLKCVCLSFAHYVLFALIPRLSCTTTYTYNNIFYEAIILDPVNHAGCISNSCNLFNTDHKCCNECSWGNQSHIQYTWCAPLFCWSGYGAIIFSIILSICN